MFMFMKCGVVILLRDNGGFLNLAAVIDLHSKAILSYKLSHSMDVPLVTDVLKDARSKYKDKTVWWS